MPQPLPGRLDPSSHLSRHASRPSIETNASGLAESTISFSAFPTPPSSIPLTPSALSLTKNVFGSPVRPLAPRRALPAQFPEALSATSNVGYTHLRDDSQPASSFRGPAASYDWNDGASGISGLSVDAAEDRLLPTSFITSLLQENKDLRRARRTSTASDALSGISEMTYPPSEDMSRYHRHGPHRGQPSRLGGPPSSFMPIPEASVARRVSSDSETLHSVQGLSAKPRSPAENHHSPTEHQALPMPVSNHEMNGRYREEYDSDSIMQYKATFQPPPYAGTDTLGRNPRNNVSHEARQSVHSFKSVAPSFISRISVPRSVRRLLGRGKAAKPLPPVPLIPDISLAVEARYRREDEAAPLPDLVSRAGQLHGLLEKEYNHDDGYGYGAGALKSDVSSVQTQTQTLRSEPWQPLRRRDLGTGGIAPTFAVYSAEHGVTEARQGTCSCFPSLTKRAWIFVAFIVATVLVVIIAVPVVFSSKKFAHKSCELGFAGTLCNLNAICDCTSTSPCNGLARNLVDLIPTVNQQFSANYTLVDVYTSLWLAQGITSQNDCSAQAWLVDTGASLDVASYPNRTHWAQAALLWHIVQTQDVQSAAAMQKFVRSVPWIHLKASDGPTNTDSTAFTSIFAGYAYNFATQTVSEPAASFANQGRPSSAQAARVGQKAEAALDRMYTFALASSTQRDVALQNFWATTLLQRAGDLGTFKNIVSQSPVLLPFNGSSSSIQSLYNSSSMLFPPPLGCYPGFSPQSLAQIQTFETTVFNLDNPTAASNFDPACFPDRPVYGILDLLRLRLPYMESRPWLPRQAAVLKADALPRVVVYANEVLSATFPGTTPVANITQSELDPREFGTLNLPNHVLLQYLMSMPVDIATALVQFVLNTANSPAIPPDPSTPLFQALSSIPVLEVAVFGDIGPSDISGTVSSFMTSAGAFFFGSDPGSAFRNWSISSAGGAVTWTENSTSPRIVRDNSLTDATLDQTWAAVASNGRNVGLSNLTDSLQATQKFTAV